MGQRDAIPIKNLLEDFLKKTKSNFNSQEKLITIVKDNTQKKIRKYIDKARVYKNRLTVYTTNSGANFILNLEKQQILEAVKKDFPGVAEIKIKTGG